MNVKTTKLYKTLAPRIRKQDRKFFGESLQLAADAHSLFEPDARDLGDAFVWHFTPQGGEFWRELHHRLRDAGHYDEIRAGG